MNAYVRKIIEDGVVVMPLLDERETDLFRAAFQRTQLEFPEYKQTAHARELPYVFGGFGAYGNPSSFHNQYIRTLRLYTAEKMIRFFGALARAFNVDNPIDGPTLQHGRWVFEMLFDRMCLRPQGSKTSKESAHRDLNPQTIMPTGRTVRVPNKDTTTAEFKPKAHDYCFGGWINMDDGDHDQIFSCVKGTHTDDVTMTRLSRSGFATNEDLRGEVVEVRVPPGHIVVFFQRIQHIVTGRTARRDSYRQFRCWRLFHAQDAPPEPLGGWEAMQECIDDFAVPRLPSNQIPPMYSSNHRSSFLFKGGASDPIPWSAAKFKAICLETAVCGSGVHRGESYDIVHRFMKSLREYGMTDAYPRYQENETMLMVPNFTWDVPETPRIDSVDDIMTLRVIRARTKEVRLVN
jgi:hypothetical protein